MATYSKQLIKPSLSRGFTLIEIMVVVVILGLLAALIAPKVVDRVGDARVVKAKQDIRNFETALELYKMDNLRYPDTAQGLQALMQKPAGLDLPNYKDGGYLNKLTKDPWGKPYLYIFPGANAPFDVYTLGGDGQTGGEGEDADIGNWTIED